MPADDISFADLKVRVVDKGGKARDVPILRSLANEPPLHLASTGRGTSSRHPARGVLEAAGPAIAKEVAAEAGIMKRVYPYLLRHTTALRLADRRMPENLLQRFLGHESPETTHVYYEPSRANVDRAFREAMGTALLCGPDPGRTPRKA